MPRGCSYRPGSRFVCATQRVGELDDTILKPNTCSSGPSAGFGHSLAGRGIETRAVIEVDCLPAEAADDCEIDVQRRAQRRQISSRLVGPTTRTRSITRGDEAARRSFVTVSAMPDASHASSRSPLTFVKSITAIAGCEWIGA
jgi:hypothetical protein